MIEALKQYYADALAKLRENEATSQRLAKEHPLLQAEVEGLKLALQRHGETVEDGIAARGVAASQNGSLVDMSRPAAIKYILSQTEVPLSPTDLLKRLQEGGRDNDSPHVVSAALSGLKDKGVVRSRSRGQWELVSAAYGRGGGGRPFEPLHREAEEGLVPPDI